MQVVRASLSVSISDLKKSPTDIINKAGNRAVSILNHNVPTAYIVPPKLYNQMLDIIDEYELSKEVALAKKSKQKPIKVKIDEL